MIAPQKQLRHAKARVDMWWLAAAWSVASLLRAGFARWIPTPQIVSDEIRFIAIATDVAHGALAGPLSTFAKYPFDLYAILLAPLERVFPGHLYTASKLLDGPLVSSACFPTWLLARRVLPRAWARTAGMLTLGLPALSYASTVMAENLYLPLCLWSVELALRWVKTRRAGWGFALALAGGGLLFTKAQGAYVLAGLTALPLIPAFGGSLRRRVWWLLLLGSASTGAGLLFAVTCYVRLGFAFWERFFDPTTWLGYYAIYLHSDEPRRWADEAKAWAANFLGAGGEFAPGLGVVVFIAAVQQGWAGRRRTARLLAPLVCLWWVVFTRQGVWLALYFDHGLNAHERYVIQLAPLFLILAAAVVEGEHRRNRTARLRVMALAASAAGLSIAAVALLPFRSDHLVNDCPGLSWTMAVKTEQALTLFVGAGVAMTGWALFTAGSPSLLALGTALSIALTSIGMSSAQHLLANDEHARKVKLVPFSQKLFHRGAPIYFLMDELDPWQIWVAEAFTDEGEGKAYCFAYDHGLCLDAGLQDDGRLAVLESLPAGSVLVTSDAITLDAPLADRDGPYRAWRLTGAAVHLVSEVHQPPPYP